jgi:protein-L-isoaspartate(D-aspartate) O-methyltransferase|tara:strand:- start:3993 stop:4643 length:651 start_codon:yes stop_codon:yes gene_type:complete
MRIAEDTFRTKGMRRKLIDHLRGKGISDENVLDAMMQVPRHVFFDTTFIEVAYEDKAFPIGAGQTISHPYTVAYQSQLLNVKRGDKILEIGTGSGYQAAVLVTLGAKLFTIERQRSLYLKTKEILPKMGFRPKFFYGDGYKGLPSFAPFDKLIVTCGAPFIPEDLKAQVKIGGLIVIPVGGDDLQKMMYLKKISETDFEIQETGDFAFVPMLENKE